MSCNSVSTSTVSPLYRNLQVANFQRCFQSVFHHWHLREIAACPPSPVADHPSTPPSPVSSPSSSLELVFFVHWSLAPVCQLLLCTTVLFKVLYYKLKNVFFIFVLVFDVLFVYSVQSLSCVWLFATPWTTARQASLSITNPRSPPKPMSIESVMPSNHLILCCPLLLLPSKYYKPVTVQYYIANCVS